MTAYLDAANRIATILMEEALNSFPLTIVIGFMVWALLKGARKFNASTRHAIWWAALFAVLCAAPLRIAVKYVEWPADHAPSAMATVASPLPAAAPLVTAEPAHSPQIGPELERKISAGRLPLIASAALCLWLLIQLIRIAFSYAYLRRLKASGVKPSDELRVNFDEWCLSGGVGREVKLLLSDRIQSPIAVGFRHPAVLIPRSLVGHLDGADLDHMLLHELAHLARRDDWSNLAVRVAWGLVGFHPIAAFILRRIEEERELACDDWVVVMTGQARPYAVSLSKLVEFRLMQSREMLATGIGGRRSHVAGRIERLLKAGSHFDSRLSLARIGMTLTVLVLAIAAGMQAPSWIVFAQEPPASQVVAPLPPEQPEPPAPVSVQAPPPPPAPRMLRPTPASTASTPAIAPVPPPSMGTPAAIAPRAQPATPRSPSAAAAVLAPPAPPAPPAPENRTSFLKALADAGYSDLPVDAIIELRTNGVSAEFLAAANQAGWGRLPVAQLIELRNAGVSPEYLKAAKDAALRALTLKDVILLRNQGVRMDAVREIHSLGFGPYDARQAIEFYVNGVRPDYFRSLRDAGFTNLDPKDIIEARRHNIRGNDLAEARKYGSNLTLPQIIRLKQAGVI
jgi:beta-lactamase regulating signal transducer with metallopeptidase domain